MMITFEHGADRICCGTGDDIGPYMRFQPESEIFSTLMSFTMCNDGFYLLYDTWLNANPNLQGCSILHAHGIVKRGVWYFKGSEGLVPIQDWIDKENKQDTALCIICCCNPKNKGTIVSKNSLIFHPRSACQLTSMMSRRCKMKAFVPGEGYFDSIKGIEEIRSLASRIKANMELKVFVP
jgi:hypothetical protein